MRALKITLVLFVFGVLPTAYFAFAQSSGSLPAGRLCTNICLDATPVPTNTSSVPPENPPTPTPVPTRNYGSEWCVADTITGQVLEDRCGDVWGPTVSQQTINGQVLYFCTCNTRRGG